jgi:two-component system, LytTR family, response regulator
MKYRTLIIDDEPLARDVIRVWLVSHPEIELIGECANGENAVDSILSMKPQLVFLDVQMPDRNGFEVIDAISNIHVPEFVFVTAYDDYALKAFEVTAVDYLLKPFTRERFDRAVERATRRIDETTSFRQSDRLIALTEKYARLARQKSEASPNNIVIKTRGKIVFVPRDSIMWVEADGDYIRIHSRTQTYQTQETLQSFEQRLRDTHFARIHRSVIVNLNKIKELHPHLNGEYFILLHDGTKLKLSRSYKSKLHGFLDHPPH